MSKDEIVLSKEQTARLFSMGEVGVTWRNIHIKIVIGD